MHSWPDSSKESSNHNTNTTGAPVTALKDYLPVLIKPKLPEYCFVYPIEASFYVRMFSKDSWQSRIVSRPDDLHPQRLDKSKKKRREPHRHWLIDNPYEGPDKNLNTQNMTTTQRTRMEYYVAVKKQEDKVREVIVQGEEVADANTDNLYYEELNRLIPMIKELVKVHTDLISKLPSSNEPGSEDHRRQYQGFNRNLRRFIHHFKNQPGHDDYEESFIELLDSLEDIRMKLVEPAPTLGAPTNQDDDDDEFAKEDDDDEGKLGLAQTALEENPHSEEGYKICRGLSSSLGPSQFVQARVKILMGFSTKLTPAERLDTLLSGCIMLDRMKNQIPPPDWVPIITEWHDKGTIQISRIIDEFRISLEIQDPLQPQQPQQFPRNQQTLPSRPSRPAQQTRGQGQNQRGTRGTPRGRDSNAGRTSGRPRGRVVRGYRGRGSGSGSRGGRASDTRGTSNRPRGRVARGHGGRGTGNNNSGDNN